MKKVWIILCAIIVIGSGFLISSQLIGKATTGKESENTSTITVTANGTVDIIPDIAYLSVGVITQDTDLKTAQSENTTKSTKVLDALKQASIKEENIQTSTYNIYPRNDYIDGTSKLVDYEVTNQYSIKIEDINTVGDIIDVATKAGANSIGSITFASSKDNEAYEQALTLAFKACEQKAEVLAEASKTTIDSIYNISEGSSSYTPYLTRGTAMMNEMSTSIQTGTLSVDAQVTVVYILK